MNGVDLHAVGLADVGESLRKRRVPPIVTTAPPVSLSSGQAARASRTWAKNLSA
jgi:hypothetical protein